MLELFDDNNFEKEFVDTTNDHDTMPLDEQQSSQSSFEGEEGSKPTTSLEQSGSSEDKGKSASVSSDIEEESVTEVAARAKKELEETNKDEEKEQAAEAREAW